MPIRDAFQAPSSAQELPLPDEPNAKFFIGYLASVDPATNQPWCSDVRAALPILNKFFSEESRPDVHYVYVGSKVQYKNNPDSPFRLYWNINSVPTLARYERIDGAVKEVGRLVEDELLDEKRIRDLVN